MSQHIHDPVQRGLKLVCRECGEVLAVLARESQRFPAKTHIKKVS